LRQNRQRIILDHDLLLQGSVPVFKRADLGLELLFKGALLLMKTSNLVIELVVGTLEELLVLLTQLGDVALSLRLFFVFFLELLLQLSELLLIGLHFGFRGASR